MRSAYGLDDIISNMRNANTHSTRQPRDYVERRTTAQRAKTVIDWIMALVTFVVLLAITGFLFGQALAAKKAEPAPAVECVKPAPTALKPVSEKRRAK